MLKFKLKNDITARVMASYIFLYTYNVRVIISMTESVNANSSKSLGICLSEFLKHNLSSSI